MTAVAIHPVASLGTRRVHGFACRRDGTCIHEWDAPTYPPHPEGEAIRALRVRLGISLL